MYPINGPLPSLTSGERQRAEQEWNRRRSDIYGSFEELAGIVPIGKDVQAQVLSKRELEGGVELWKLWYESHDCDQVPAYLLMPSGASEAGAVRRPAAIALHQTVPEGKDEAAGLAGDPELAYGRELAERGFVVLIPDVLTAGERIYPGSQAFQTALFEERHPNWSMVGKMIADHRYGLEWLSRLAFVDASRIAAIGHSLGGYNAFFLAAADERVRAVVCSCGFSTFAGDTKPGRWGNRKEWFTHFPKLDGYLRERTIPFEFNEIAALTCPRPLFIWAGQNDAIFPHWQAIGEGIRSIEGLYGELDARDRFMGLIGSCGHQFPRPIRNLAYEWLERALA